MAKKNEQHQQSDHAHSDENAPRSTRSDLMDAGAPMAPGSPDEAVGPEDALGAGPKRGDYSDRIDSGPHLVTEVIPDDEREEDGPHSRLVPAEARTSQTGDAEGKGGVTTEAAQ